MAELRRLWLDDFRNYRHLDLEVPSGRVLITGPNGQGKTNLLEAIGYIGTLASFRGAQTDALISRWADTAVLRAQAVAAEGRDLLIEVELSRQRPNRIQLNRQKLGSAAELVGLLPVTVFGPDDLELVKGGPSARRRYLDSILTQLHPANNALKSELDRILRQRNALLRQARGRLTPDMEITLEIWDSKLAEAGEAWGRARRALVEKLQPETDAAYADLAGSGYPVDLRYEPTWLEKGLLVALAECHADEVRRGVTLVGPHRDDLDLILAAMPARSHASQGEQRTLALALQIAGHHVVAMTRGTSPVLLLDDVFSELDAKRAGALLEMLVADQTLITTAAEVPGLGNEVHRLAVAQGAVSTG